MSPPKDLIRLRHMQDYAQEAVDLAQGKVRGDLDKDRLLGLGLARLLEIIGEAANRVSTDYQASHPSIPWSQIVSSQRDFLGARCAPYMAWEPGDYRKGQWHKPPACVHRLESRCHSDFLQKVEYYLAGTEARPTQNRRRLKPAATDMGFEFKLTAES